jgi:hypothetical protein
MPGILLYEVREPIEVCVLPDEIAVASYYAAHGQTLAGNDNSRQAQKSVAASPDHRRRKELVTRNDQPDFNRMNLASARGHQNGHQTD